MRVVIIVPILTCSLFADMTAMRNTLSCVAACISSLHRKLSPHEAENPDGQAAVQYCFAQKLDIALDTPDTCQQNTDGGVQAKLQVLSHALRVLALYMTICIVRQACILKMARFGYSN